ncbi:hypothetical protein [Variovorax sp. KBW07]|uniref:hypothetical protein n=1 Tax=Variovorax sp. KBW07 TaxID=2153358 RepID=UPI000F568410|nr:hypothetical protein [Variovorax sp. KBW07]
MGFLRDEKARTVAGVAVKLIAVAALAALAGCALQPTDVKEANGNPDAFLAKNYTLQALRPSFVQSLKEVGAPGPTDFKEITFKFNHRYRNIGATEDSVTTPQASYRPLGNGFFQHIRTVENNGFLANRSFELTFMGVLNLKKENASTDSKMTQFTSVVKEVKPFKFNVAKLAPGSKLLIDFGNGFPLQEFNFRWSKFTCLTDRLGSASELHPKIQGGAIWFSCDGTSESGAEAKFTNVYLAQYGLMLTTKYADSKFSGSDTVSEFTVR